MENNQNFEERIKAELKLAGNNVKPSNELYSVIMEDIKNKKKGSIGMFRNKFAHMGAKKFAAALVCLVVVLGGISYSASPDFRAFAAETAEKIKTIFILDTSNNVVEKDINQVPLQTIVSKLTTISDAELSDKVGFKVVFPDTLKSDFRLIAKSETLSLNKIDYDVAQGIQNDALEAIDNMDKFKSLEKYDPVRGVSALYVNTSGRDIFVNIVPDTVDYEKRVTASDYNIKTLDINGTKVYWNEPPVPVYPTVEKDGQKQPDWTQKPIKIETAHQLIWFSDDLFFCINIGVNQDYSAQEIENAARAFIEAYTK
jgi:hypothetical protein